MITGNYGLNTAGVTDDPGWYADWHFIDHIQVDPADIGGSGICPVAGVVTEAHGTLVPSPGNKYACESFNLPLILGLCMTHLFPGAGKSSTQAAVL